MVGGSGTDTRGITAPVQSKEADGGLHRCTPMAQTIEIGGEVFPSKEAVKRRVQPLLKAVGPLAPADETFVRALLLRHRSAATKIGAGIKRIRVWKVLPYGTFGFYIDRVDGTGTDFSYLECLDPSTPLDKFTAACRTTIQPQVQAAKDVAFAEFHAIACPVTGGHITRDTCHVDHAKPWTFRAIVDAFILECRIDITAVPLGGQGDGETTQSFENPAFAHAFAEFHRGRAKLQVVSVPANLSVLKKKKFAPKDA